jgi:hypothetical protein
MPQHQWLRCLQSCQAEGSCCFTHTGHDHAERSALLGIPQVNMVNDSCAFNMHFVNWFWNRVKSGSIGGTNQDFVAVDPTVLENMRRLYQPGVCCAVLRLHASHGSACD